MSERRSTREPLVASAGRAAPPAAVRCLLGRLHEPTASPDVPTDSANEAYTTHNQMMTQYFNRVRFDELATRTALVH